MSQFRVEKHRAPADLTLVTGTTVSGSFFLADSLPARGGPERVGDLLNAESGFFPFERADGTTILYNRAHVVMVALPPGINEAELDTGYDVATRRVAMMVLSTGAHVAGTVAVYRPFGHDRLSDYARSDEQFRYLVSANRTLIVNCSHIVELREVAD
jgi:hypothetical protein